MSGFLDSLERDLVDAARRRAAAARPRRRWWPSLPLAGALVVTVAGTAAAGTLFVLRGSAIPAPRDAAPEQTPAPGTSRLAGYSVADPDATQPPWSLRIATSRTGLLCSTVGQLDDGAFGLVGLDDRFRPLAEGVVDSCSVRRDNASSLVGVRTFTAKRDADVRSVVSGVAGEELRGVTLDAAGARRAVATHDGGTFLAVLRGLPEDLGLRVTLRFADGHVERHPFGVSQFVAPDPAGGHAWKTQSGVISGDRRDCVSFLPARQVRNGPLSPSACGVLGGSARHPRGYYFALRRLTPGPAPASRDPFPFAAGRWGRHPPRTAVWGRYGEDVARISATGPAGSRQTSTAVRPSGTFLILFGPKVLPSQVTVTIHFEDGRTEERRMSTGLVDHRVPTPVPERVARSQRRVRAVQRALAQQIRREREGRRP